MATGLSTCANHPKDWQFLDFELSEFNVSTFVVPYKTRDDLVFSSGVMTSSPLPVNDYFSVGLTSASPHFVKSTFGAGDSENDNVVDKRNIDSEAQRQAHSGPGGSSRVSILLGRPRRSASSSTTASWRADFKEPPFC